MQTISEKYRSLNAELHARSEHYGSTGANYVDYIADICKELKTTDVLDYGCGKGYLNCHLPFEIQQYDPAILKHAAEPTPAEVVACIDVLEHIEPEYLSNVLDHLAALTKQRIFATVHVGPAKKTLEDGRNAHLIQQPPEFWLIQFMERFEIIQYNRMIADEGANETLLFFCKPRKEHTDGTKQH